MTTDSRKHTSRTADGSDSICHRGNAGGVHLSDSFIELPNIIGYRRQSKTLARNPLQLFQRRGQSFQTSVRFLSVTYDLKFQALNFNIISHCIYPPFFSNCLLKLIANISIYALALLSLFSFRCSSLGFSEGLPVREIGSER